MVRWSQAELLAGSAFWAYAAGMPTAGAIIIGDEILSGKVEDLNTPLLIRVLRDVGVRLQRIVVIGDDPADIADAVRDCVRRYDHVFCSGGLGPTHDDRTIEGIALAFGRPVVRHPTLVALLHRLLGDRINEAALKMAEVVEGTQLLDDGHFPALALENVYILPGIPQVFADKLEAIRPHLSATPLTLQRLFVCGYESAFADKLTQVDREFPEVQIGSYPRLDQPDYQVMVTVEGDDRDQVVRAMDRLLELLPAELVVRVER